VAGVAYLSNRPPPPEGPPPAGEPVPLPVQAVLLVRGIIPLDLPFMVMYTPAVNTTNYTVSTHVEFEATREGAANVSYLWRNVTGADLPIVFRHLSPLEDLEDPPNTFRLFPTGVCLPQAWCITYSWSWPYPGSAYLLTKAVDVNYSVFLVRPNPPFERAEWLEVRFSIEGTSRWDITGRLPRENITEAAGEDRVPLGSQVVVYGSEFRRIYLDELELPISEFHYDLQTFTFDAGIHGTITAKLGSTFRWSPWTRYWIDIDLRQSDMSYPDNATFQLYVDRRFGSLIAEQVA